MGQFSDRTPRLYSLESTNDGQRWQKLATNDEATTADGVTTVNFPPATIRTIRLSITQTNDGLPAALDEIDIDGPKGITCHEKMLD